MPGRALPAFLLLILLGACATPLDSGLLIDIEDRPGDGVIRISNPSPNEKRVYFEYLKGFGDYQMLLVRFRDSTGRIVNSDDPSVWFSVNYLSSNLPVPGDERKGVLKIPARSHVDLARDIPALTWGMKVLDEAEPPCEMQIRLYGYRDLTSDLLWDVRTDWQPAPCPAVSVWRGDRR